MLVTLHMTNAKCVEVAVDTMLRLVSDCLWLRWLHDEPQVRYAVIVMYDY